MTSGLAFSEGPETCTVDTSDFRKKGAPRDLSDVWGFIGNMVGNRDDIQIEKTPLGAKVGT